jgi:hypothetical protein
MFDGKSYIYLQNEPNIFKKVSIPSSPNIACGIEAFFFPINSKRGLKCYNSRVNANNAFKRQQKAFINQIGPKVLSKKVFKIIFPVNFDSIIKRNIDKSYFLDFFKYNSIGYGYFTEIVQTFKRDRGFTNKEYHELSVKINDVFPRLNLEDDLHFGNLGRIKGKLVCIDFGDCSAF